ncbi:condensation domain-containing protein, partial [Niallia taxi]
PLTKNGKIDKKELPLPNNRDMVTIEYVAPENDIQRNLVDIWSDILGIEKIGIDDNFFDLGGDSIKAIRITSRLLKFGYKLEIKHLFKYGNIKEISKRVTSNVNKISQKEVTGEAPLIPIQKMFFESNFTNQQHWNQSVMIFNEDGFHENAIKRVLTELIKHHDALRMIYKTNANSITQIIRSSEMKLYDMYVKDFRTSHNVKDLIEACCNELQSSIDLEAGPLVKVGLFKTKEGDHLLLSIHHLVIDGVSWRILLEDFAEGYNQEIRSEKITFQQKTHSFKDWGNYLEGQVKSNSLKGEIEYWSQLEKINIKDLPVDKESESLNKWYDFKDIQVSFSKKETDNLLKSTNRAYNTEINDLLLTALGLAFNQGMEIDKFFVTLEGHGREIIGRDIDISRTVGWFTTHYPVVIDTNQYQLNHSIKNVKETLRKVPNKGIGYGILKYMESGEKWQGVNPKVKFNYLGQFDESINNHLFEISKLSTGDSISLDSERLYEIDISGIVSNHELSINFSYNSEKYHEHTMNNLASAFKHQLLSIIDHCMSLQRPETTPSDYTDSAMTFDELEVIKNKYEIQKKNKIEDIYPLTPMQNGMLFHSLLDRESVTYFEQKSFTTMGEMDVELLEKSFFKVIERYEILRTMIAYENMKTAKQVILGEYKEKVRYEDISILKEEEKSLYLEGFLDKDRKEGFNLSENFLVRLSVLKLNNKEHKVIWSSHHILMDGWCSSLIMNDLFAIYSSLKNQKTLELKEPAPYVEYVKWLEEQSENNAKEYWANYVKGYSNHPQLPIKTGDHSQVFKKDRIDFTIDKQMTNSLNNISKIAQVTINTVIQSIWGLLIQKYTGMEDIIFGSVVSGRNAKVEAIEEMVGLFINTIPVRVQTTSKDLRFVDLIKDVQQASLESSKFDYYPLAEIQSLSEVKHNLVNHIMMFQNFHVNESLDYSTEELDFSIEDINVHEQTNYDFDVMVIPRDELTVMFSYNESLYNREFVIQLKEHFLKMLRTIIKNHEVKISELSIITEPEK